MYLETVKGNMIDVENPNPDQIDVEDIAWGLSRLSRFAGHTITEIPYNVAQHCLFVSEICNEMKEMINNPRKDLVCQHALLHDAAEAYIGDIPSPIKHIPTFHPIIKTIEENLMNAICQRFGLETLTQEEFALIKHADKIAQRIEAHAFMSSRGKDWKLPEVTLEQLQKFSEPKNSLCSYNEYIRTFYKLKGQ